jgi:hypothetical protein
MFRHASGCQFCHLSCGPALLLKKIRQKIPLMKIIKLISFAALLVIPTVSRAGDSVTKDSVTKIISLPYTISAPGKYEVTADLTANGTDGIDVNASNVTLNLGGFSITQLGSAGTTTGVNDPSSDNVVVENGTISGFNREVFFGPYTTANNCKAQNLRVCKSPARTAWVRIVF